MRRADFDIAAEAVRAREVDLQPAQRLLSGLHHLLALPGVSGIWAGARAAEPYIMLSVSRDSSGGLSRSIPDSIEGVSIYYLEGQPY